MIRRPIWIESIDLAWKKRPLVWMTGVRRVGKTEPGIFLGMDG